MIYYVEDDSSIRDLMVYALRAAGFSAVGCADGEEFWQAMHRETPELVILDIMLPGEDGISILKKLRAAPVTADIPVIMATAKGTEYDRVIGLDLGADDYLTKPFGMMEMVSRIRAVLRRAGPKSAPAVLRQGSILMDEGRGKRYAGYPHAQGVRSAAAAFGKPWSGVQPRPSAFRRLGHRLLRRDPHGRCPHWYPAYQAGRSRGYPANGAWCWL